MRLPWDKSNWFIYESNTNQTHEAIQYECIWPIETFALIQVRNKRRKWFWHPEGKHSTEGERVKGEECRLWSSTAHWERKEEEEEDSERGRAYLGKRESRGFSYDPVYHSTLIQTVQAVMWTSRSGPSLGGHWTETNTLEVLFFIIVPISLKAFLRMCHLPLIL